MKPNTDDQIISNIELFTLVGDVLYRKTNLQVPAGHHDKSSGYFKVKILGRSCLSHRVVFYLANGYLPTYIDHIDRNKLNNSPSNLRACDKPRNVVNSLVRKDNKFGYKGVTYHKAAKKFVAQTFTKGKRVHIGVYETPEEAAIVYNNKIRELFGEHAILNEIRK